MLSNSPNKSIVVFDGECLLCNQSVQFLLNNDTENRLSFCTLKYANEKGLIQKLSSLPDSFIFIKNQKAYTESDAVLQVAKELGGIYSFAVVFFIIPKFLRDIPYKLIAKYRYKIWGSTESCMMMRPEHKRKILDYA